jgi:hypothetical protein
VRRMVTSMPCKKVGKKMLNLVSLSLTFTFFRVCGPFVVVLSAAVADRGASVKEKEE